MEDQFRLASPWIPRLGDGAMSDPALGLSAGELIGALSRVLRAEDIEQGWTAAVDGFRALGFVEVIYGYSPDARGAVLGAAEDFLVLSTLERTQSREMVARNLHMQSVTFTWALQNVGVASWSMPAAEAGLPPDYVHSPESLEFFARNRMEAGISVGFASARTRGAAALALVAAPEVPQAAVDAWLPRAGEAVFVLASVMHRALAGLPWPRLSGDLTERQREVLEWVAEGKTTADIACIMGLKPATVEKHLRLARACLGVETTAHALIKAAFMNQVFVRGGSFRGPGDD